MAFDAKTERLISLKKLAGKAHTSNDKGLANEGLPSGLTVSANTVFGQNIPLSPGTSLYSITNGAVEKLRLSASFIPGTDTLSGRHGFSLQLPDDYESQSSNPNAGTYPFINGQTIYITSGALQLIPPSFANAYEGKPYHTGSGQTSIPVLDARDWNLDYFNGIFFQQDPPGTNDHSSNPRYIDAYLYIGDYLSSAGNFTTITGSLTQLSDGSSYLRAGSNVTISTGSDGSVLIAATGEFSIDDDIVATLTGSEFSGATKFNAGLSGSLTTLADGRSYLTAGNNVTITSESNGQITISSSGGGGSGSPGGSDTQVQFNSGGSFSGDSNFTFNASSNTLTVTNITGSLTRLSSGVPYLSAGKNISITTASSGQVTVEAAAFYRTARNKSSYAVTSSHTAMTAFTVANTDFSEASFSSNLIDVVYNGMILYSGSTAQVSAGNADYTISGQSEIKFGFDLSNDDLIHTTVIASGSIPNEGLAPTNAPYITYGENSGLTAERVLMGANGILVDTSNVGQVRLKIQRIKTVYYVTGTHAEGETLTIPGASFNSGSYNEKRIDLYVNGQLMVSGSSRDYVLEGNATDVSIKFPLETDDTVVVVVQ
tara:strand:+ start:1960 stop:3756 length:1797 start_codon:yes stop_codon:yes gene_type:complete